MERLISCLGVFAFVAMAWAMSSDRRRVDLRLIATGVGLQLLAAVLILKTSPGQWFFEGTRDFVTQLISFSDAGAELVFGENFKEHYFAFSVLPTIIFVSSFMAVLFYLGWIQKVVEGMAWIMVRVMRVSGAESLAASANVFVGQTEAPLVIKPYIDSMTRSEIMAMMTGGMATIAGGVMVSYVGFGADPGHLLTASVMSAPAALVIAKLMIPETEQPKTMGTVKINIRTSDANVIDAACRGATEGLILAANVAGMLLAFVALTALINYFLGWIPELGGSPVTVERILGYGFAPIAWIMGVEWKDCLDIGMLLGKKVFLNEFVAYLDLRDLKDTLAPRSFTIATYALCGFANFASIAIQIGGIGNLVPSRRRDFAQLGVRAMIGGTLAALMTATIAGILI